MTKTPIEWDGYPVPMDLWGKDHWSTFAYLETRVVDHRGVLDQRHLRGHLAGWEEYATRLNNGTEVFGHSDYDCIDDMITEGLVTGPDIRPANGREGTIAAALMYHRKASFYATDAFALTPEGAALAGRLREHKGNGHNFASFVPDNLEVPA